MLPKLYILGSIVLFIGLFWLFAPHAIHGHVDETLHEDNQEKTHISHIIQGLAITLSGLGLMGLSNRLEKKGKKRRA